MTPQKARRAKHLVSVWNPAKAENALVASVQMLLDAARSYRAGQLEEEDVYVWWGKVRSSNRQQPLPHLEDILSLDEDLKGDDGPQREAHLYLTDYRALYVAHLAEVTDDNVLESDPEHVPAFYGANRMNCDCWFRLFDIRRLVADDTAEVVRELEKLRNTRYHDRPVSIYGGMVDLPLIVTREDGARFFEADVRSTLTDGKFWVEFDAEWAGIGSMEQELRLNVLGDTVWNALDPGARTFIATAESLFRSHRQDPTFDFSAVVVDLAKAFEVQVNLILRRATAALARRERTVNMDGRSVDLASGELWNLNALARTIADNQDLNGVLKRKLANGEWFASSLPPILRELADKRNPAAHQARVTREVANDLRNRILGIGVPAAVTELARVKVR
jgi:hypothetical protein